MVSTVRSRARWVRGALVGACSAIVAAAAHTAAGAGLPQGAAVTVALLICAMVGAAAGGVRVEGRLTTPLAVTASLAAAQVCGHLTLVAAGGHHHGGDLQLTPSMAATHAVAAVALGVAITAVEHLYVVCASVLCWLRLFASRPQPPTARPFCGSSKDVVAQSVLLCAGLGMRAPPRGLLATA